VETGAWRVTEGGGVQRDSGADHRTMEPTPLTDVPSGAMNTDPRDDDRGQVSLGQRLRQPRTIASILVPFLVFAVFFYLNRDQLGRVPGLVLGANPLLILAAFVVFYLGFPLRGYRWSLLLRGTGFRIGVRDSTEIIFLSWLVNCVVPAKLGDVYRAYLLKINSDASLSRTFGTVFIERILDLVAIALLGLAAGYWSFRDGLPPAIELVFVIGIIVVVVLAGGLFTLRNFGRRILVALPIPERIVELYDRFEEGVFDAIPLRALPILAFVTALTWFTEAMRLFLVIRALDFADVSLGISGAFFVALIGSLLTAVPLSPAGLGIVEAGVVGVLTVAYGVPLPEATAIALLDRVISVFSIIVLGSIGYLVSSKPRGEGRIADDGRLPGTA
jgi:glycosyltransferase 2 family protein